MASARFSLLAFIACIIYAAIIQAQPTSRILGGSDATINAFPYAVSIRYNNAHTCGGSILNEDYILTAAHCVQDRTSSQLSVRVGSINQFAGGHVIGIAAIIIHPDYDDIMNNIALLQLATSLSFENNNIKPIEIATSDDEVPEEGASVIVAGWGEMSTSTTPYKLQHFTFTIASDDVCTDAFDQNDDSIICLDHSLQQGSCTGDAGNGAVYNDKLIGVSNYVIGACGARYPDVFINVAHYADWIHSVINKTA